MTRKLVLCDCMGSQSPDAEVISSACGMACSKVYTSLCLDQIDDAVRRILTLKFQLGLFDNPYTDPADYPAPVNSEHLAAARKKLNQLIRAYYNSTHYAG